MVAWFSGIFYTCIKQTKTPENCFCVRLSGDICKIFIPQWPIYTAEFAGYIALGVSNAKTIDPTSHRSRLQRSSN
jgi:hypothetical protein